MKFFSHQVIVITIGTILLLGAVRGKALQHSEANRMEAAIDRAIAGQQNWNSLRFEAECEVDSKWRSAEIYGTGVGIWERRVQVSLSNRHIRDILETVKETRFAQMPAAFDGKSHEIPTPPAVSPDGRAGLKVVCRTKIWLEDLEKEVVQLQRAKTSVELRSLTTKILQIAEELAQNGTTADSLADGLHRLSRGDLAPETLRILYHRKPQEVAIDNLGQGFLTRINGRGLSVQSYAPGEGYGAEREFDLSATEFSDLISKLSAQHPETLPPNLYAEHYTDLSISVLNHQVSAQARQFSGMTPQTLGERQERFNRISALLYQMSQRADSADHYMTTAAKAPVK